MLGLKTLSITPNVLALTCDVDAFKGYWAALEKHSTGLNLLSEFAIHGQKFRAVMDQLGQHDITPEHILAIYNGLVSKGIRSDWRNQELIESVVDSNDELCGYLETADPSDIQPLLHKLTVWMNETIDERAMHPVLAVSMFHAIFLQIAPFSSHNQKLCNILTQIYLFKADYTYTPYVPLENVIADHAKIYYRALKQYQNSVANGELQWRGWFETFIPILLRQADILRIKLENDGKDLSHLPKLSAEIMALFERHDRLKMKQILDRTSGARATIKLRLKELLDSGYIKRHGGGRSTWYGLT